MLLRSNRWFHIVPSGVTPRLRLFCFPYGGAGHSIFLDWPRLLPADVQVCMVRLPGRAPRFAEPAFDDVQDIVADFIDVIATLCDVPFVLLGHSFGALAAFELARELGRLDLSAPECLIASGRNAPQVPYSGPLLHQMDEDALKTALRHIGGTPESILSNNEVFRAYLPMLKADFAVTERYVYQSQPKLSCPIHAFAGKDDALAPADAVSLWAEQTSAAFSLQQFPGDHFFINTSRQAVVATVDTLMKRLSAPAG